MDYVKLMGNDETQFCLTTIKSLDGFTFLRGVQPQGQIHPLHRQDAGEGPGDRHLRGQPTTNPAGNGLSFSRSN